MSGPWRCPPRVRHREPSGLVAGPPCNGRMPIVLEGSYLLPLFLAVWVVVVGFMMFGPLRRVVADQRAFRHMLVTLVPALAAIGTGFALTPGHERLGFFLFGLGLLLYGFNWLTHRTFCAHAFTVWFASVSPLSRTEARGRT